jgi:hypothetical protein
MAQRNGTGMFPREVMNRFPLLSLEEEGRLNDMPLRENFIERVFAYYRWMEMLEEYRTASPLVRFHTAHKLTLMAHSPKHYTEMARRPAGAASLQTPASGTGTDSPRSMAPNSWRASL